MLTKTKIAKSIIVLSLWLMALCFVKVERAQTVANVMRGEAEGAYWNATPKPWFTRLVVVSYKNRKLAVDEHDDSLPTVTGYYYRRVEASPFTRFPFRKVVVKRGFARFTTRAINGTHFVFRGTWGTEYLNSANIPDVPFMKGTLFTYKNGKLTKRERVKFTHAVNA